MEQNRFFSSCRLALIAGLVFACNRPERDVDSSGEQHEVSSEKPATRAELDSARATFSRAFATGDSTAFDSLFILDIATIDMAGMDPEPLRGVSGVRVFATRVVSDKAPGGPRFTPESMELQGADPRESGQWIWSPGSQTTQGSYSIAWRRDPSGRWRVAEYSFTMR
jgi:hypothetical protein